MDFIANENGFKIEKHQVVTSDGYVLGIWRIPGKLQSGNDNEVKPAVLLQHGLESDMMQWVFNRPEVAPAFVMARAGYDVWMGNNRGNRFSQGHVSLNPNSK
jgi:pimeloyl-ACP methyl ester carboxylesterase